jgi:hypothetical protein
MVVSPALMAPGTARIKALSMSSMVAIETESEATATLAAGRRLRPALRSDLIARL